VGVIQSGGQVKAREESRCQTCLGKGSEFRGWTSLRGGIRVSVLRRLLCRDSSKDHSHSRSLALARGRSVHGRCCSLGNASSQNSRPASGQSGQRNHCPVASGAPTALHPASVFGTARWRLTLPAGHPPRRINSGSAHGRMAGQAGQVAATTRPGAGWLQDVKVPRMEGWTEKSVA
jgi:hypothetical protein